MTLRARTGSAGRAVRTMTQSIARVTRRATHAGGAGRTGLGNLIELGAVNSAGDALIAVALAGTMFFNLDVKQAQGQVALYLLVTMAPFALVAPLIGPALDHMRHVRRIAISGTMLARALLCWGMAGAVLHQDPVTLMPAAFGALVLSKAFGVSRSAVTPRVLPEGLNLVTANARASFCGLVAAAIVAPLGAGLVAVTNAGWALRIATLVFAAGAILGMRLPAHVDTPETAPDPETAATAAAPEAEEAPEQGRWRTLLRVGPVVGEAMRANAALRALSGFLILYLAFLLRTEGFVHPVSPNIALGLLAASAGLGGLVGTALGALLKARAPLGIVFSTLAFATVTAAVCALFFGLIAALAVAFVGALGQSLGKLSLDAIVQREIGEEVRSSTFAVSETIHQLVWVIGGLTGLGMSIVASNGHIALAIVAAALAVTLIGLIYRRAARRVVRRRDDRRKSERSVADTAA